jgi:hypothetical protein
MRGFASENFDHVACTEHSRNCSSYWRSGVSDYCGLVRLALRDCFVWQIGRTEASPTGQQAPIKDPGAKFLLKRGLNWPFCRFRLRS